MRKLLCVLVLMLLSASLWAAQPTISSSPTSVVADKPVLQAVKAPGSPKAITWTTIDSITPMASRLAAAACMGKAYRIGGNCPTTTYSDAIQEYDPAVGTWVTKAPLLIAISNLCAAAWRDQIYIPGGYNGAYLDNLQIYYVNGDSVAQGPVMPSALYGASAAVLADTLYVFGGNNGAAVNTVYAYDLVNKVWTTKTAMPTARFFAGAAVQNGLIYVVGGNTADLAVCERYDPKADTVGGTPWTTMTPMNTARGGLGVAAIGQSIYAFGGGYSSYLNTVEKYDPKADTAGGTPWTPDTSFVFGRRTTAATALGNTAYVIGGWSGAFRGCAESGVTDAPVYNDAALTRIEIPQYLGNYGVVVGPYISVTNLSPVRQYNVPVTLTVDSAGTQVYKGTGFVNLDSAASDYAVLPNWSACTTPGIVYTFKAWVSWPLDQNAANDTLTVTTEIKDAIWYQHDPYVANAFTSQNFEPTNDIYDSYILDDFWISGVDSVWLDSAYVSGMYWNGTGPLDSMGIIITPDSSGLPSMSNAYFSGYYTPANYTENTGSFMIRFPQQVKVYGNNPGMWICFQGQMNYTPGGQYGVNPYTGALRGSYGAIFYNPGGGFGLGTGYNPATVLGSINNVAFSLYGGLTPTGVAGQPDQAVAPKFGLKTAWPNPSYNSANIFYTLPKAETVKLAVYSITGQLVRSLVNNNQAAGEHRVSWDGRDGKGNRVAAGIYLYRLAAGNNTASGKIVMLR
jgi:hypothetical protein